MKILSTFFGILTLSVVKFIIILCLAVTTVWLASIDLRFIIVGVLLFIVLLAIYSHNETEKEKREDLRLKAYNEEHGTNYTKYTIINHNGEREAYYKE